MTKRFGVDWVPILDIPWQRRLQTIATLIHINFFAWAIIFVPIFYLYLLISTRWWWLVLLYSLWALYDLSAAKRGSRSNAWVRSWRVWKLVRDYFPVTLEKTATLDPKRNYIIGYHPHGIASVGATLTFTTDAMGFAEKFPGINTYLCTLVSNFLVALRREILIWLGFVDASKESIEYLLTKTGPGTAVAIVIGGVHEMLEAGPNKHVLKIKGRQGFVKLALKYGADLVPVYAFGENKLFDQAANPPGSKLRKFQDWVKDMFGFSVPLFYGRGIFNYTFGFIPHRRPVHVIVGSPIHVDQVPEPDHEQINQLHQRYMASLEELFEANKLRFGITEDTHLQLT